MPPATPLSRPDPLLGSLRLRHPDVDVVVLPPVTAAAAERAVPPTPGEEVLAAAEAVRAALAEVTGAPSGGDPAAAGRERSTGWQVTGEGWHHDPGTGTRVLVARACLRTTEQDRVPALRRLGDRLLAAGWTAGPAGARRPTLEAVRDAVRSHAWVTEDGLGLAVASRPVRPGAASRRVEESR